MKEKAFAKINLCLDVVRRRDDGYHELKMIMVPLNYYDSLHMHIADKMSMVQNVGYIPLDDKNTVIKAINVLREEYGFKENFSISLTKHIPTQAGLAGGSADGAAAIRLVDRLLHLNIPKDKMLELAAKVGADVPFCCINKPAVVKGIGEIIEPFDINFDFEILLVKPKKGVMTKKAFENIDYQNCIHPDVDKLKQALENDDYDNVCHNLANTLEASSFKLNNQIEDIKKQLIEIGFDGSLMTGSGSTVFGLTRDIKTLEKGYNIMREQGYFVRKTKILQ